MPFSILGAATYNQYTLLFSIVPAISCAACVLLSVEEVWEALLLLEAWAQLLSMRTSQRLGYPTTRASMLSSSGTQRTSLTSARLVRPTAASPRTLAEALTAGIDAALGLHTEFR